MYEIGIGSLDTEIIKSEKKDTIPLFLYSVVMSANSNMVKVIVGLPKVQIDNPKNVDTIKKKFTGNFKFTLNKVQHELEVLEVGVFPECVGAFYTISDNMVNRDIILIDIGGSTFNVCLFENGEYVKSDTLPFGTMNLLHDIQVRANTLHGRKFSLDGIDKYVKRGRIGKTNDVISYKYDLAEKYIESLFSLLRLEYPYRDSDIILSGGGILLFAENIIKRIPDVNMIKNPLYSNANGFEKVGRMIWNG